MAETPPSPARGQELDTLRAAGLARRTPKVYRLITQAVRTSHVDTDALFRATGRSRRRRANPTTTGRGWWSEANTL